MSPIHRHALIWLLLLGVPVSAQEQTTWIGGRGNWFEKQNWTFGIPGQSAVANIPNGDVMVLPDGQEPIAFALELGRMDDNGFFKGVLDIKGHNLLVTTDLIVAETFNATAIGNMSIQREGKTGGSLFVNDVRIGVVNNGKDGVADGTVTLDGNLNVNENRRRSLLVGQNSSTGFATGLLDVTGDIGTLKSGYEDVTIGHFNGAAGEARGFVNGRSLSHAGGQVKVGLNTSNARDSTAIGHLTVDELIGYDQAFFGVSENGAARAVVDVHELYNVGETVLGSPNGRGTAVLTLGQDAKYTGGKLTVNRGSRVNMGSQMDVEFINAGRASVRNRPDGGPGGRVTMGNIFTQLPTGVLDLDVAGPLPGIGYETISVADGAILQGHVHLNFAKGYEPKAGQTFKFLTTDGRFTATDLNWSMTNPPRNLALLLPDANGLTAQFVEPRQRSFVTADGSNFQWTDPEIWTDKQPPQSIDDLTIVNARTRDQSVVVTPGAIARSLTIDGISNTMSLNIPRGVGLSATHGIQVDSMGEIVLDNGELLANRLELNTGAVLRGQGNFVGNLVNQGMVSVGTNLQPSVLSISGGFTQLSQGWLELDVFGTEPGEFDQIEVDGVIRLNGTLNLNIPDLSAIGPNAEIPLLSATGGIFGDLRLQFENLVGELPLGLIPVSGPDSGGMMMMLISGSGPGILGDMNWDGFVDECDLDSFALSLQDVDTYTDLHIFEPSHVGDINDDGEFDVDDIQPFFELVNGVGCEAIPLPEPSSNLLVMAAVFTSLSLRQPRTRRGRTRYRQGA